MLDPKADIYRPCHEDAGSLPCLHLPLVRSLAERSVTFLTARPGVSRAVSPLLQAPVLPRGHPALRSPTHALLFLLLGPSGIPALLEKLAQRETQGSWALASSCSPSLAQGERFFPTQPMPSKPRGTFPLSRHACLLSL